MGRDRAETGVSLSGVLVIDKPSGPSSFDVVRQVRRELRQRRVGHGGTLDPMASGVLPICLGEATKLAQFLLDADKEYEATVCFGVETDTYDAQGAVTARADAAGVTEERVRAALASFRGAIVQVPPHYSALKHRGRPLYDYARAGEPVEAPPRTVVIHQLELGVWTGSDSVPLRVHCSKGTYVRSLAFDLGRALGAGAHLTALRRTRSGPFRLAEAHPLSALAMAPLVTLPAALGHLPALRASPDAARDIAHGKRVPCAALQPEGQPEQPPAGASTASQPRWLVLRPDGSLLAVVDRQQGDGRGDGKGDGKGDDTWRAVRVFN